MADTKKKVRNNKSENIPQNVFDDITVNAIDYLKNSTDEFEAKPKYSLIHFITSLELFIKARLLKEHWTLLLDNVDKGTFENFMQGELITIDFKTAHSRLTNILQQPLSKKEFDCFEKLRKHRNKLIHFFNKDYSGKSKKVKSQVLFERSEGWYYLYRLLTEKWKDEFKDHIAEIESVNKKISKSKTFWKGKFSALKEEIDLEEKRGTIFQGCYFCGFKAVRLNEIMEHLYDGRCLICNNISSHLEIKCSNEDCNQINYVRDAFECCFFCETPIELDYLRETYEPFRTQKDMRYDDYDVHCTECYECEPTVIEFDSKYLCLSCLGLFESLSCCDWCNTQFAGQIAEGTYFRGCEFCGGSIDWHRDD